MPGPRYFGDESGNFRGLLSGNEHYFGVAVVKGEPEQCARCPKRAVRRASNVREARWADMTSVQRRRISDCIRSVGSLEAATVIVEPDDLRMLTNGFVLRQDSRGYDNDMIALACFYGAAIAELGITQESRPTFTFDRCISRSASDQVRDLLKENGFNGCINHRSSTEVRGIQLADCIIGAAVSDEFDDTEYLKECPITDISQYGMAVLEKTLSELRAGP